MNKLTKIFKNTEDVKLYFEGRNYYGNRIFKFKGLFDNKNLSYIIVQYLEKSNLTISEYVNKEVNDVKKICVVSSEYYLEEGPMGVIFKKIN